MSTTITKSCPKCGSSENVVHKDKHMHQQNHAAVHNGGHMLHGAIHGHPLGLAVVAGIWLVSKVTHGVSKPWTCSRCSHDFT